MNIPLLQTIAESIRTNPTHYRPGVNNIFVSATYRLWKVPPSEDCPCGVIAWATHITGGFPKETDSGSAYAQANQPIYRHYDETRRRMGLSVELFQSLTYSAWPKAWFAHIDNTPVPSDVWRRKFEEPTSEETSKILLLICEGVIQ